MTDSHPWVALAAPIRAPIVWDAVAVAAGRDALLLAPRLAGDAIRARLDGVVGIQGWSASFHALPGDAIACHVRIGEVTKAGVVTVNAALDGARAAERAFALAAAAVGIVAADDADLAPRWVACDVETLAVSAEGWGEAPTAAAEGTLDPAAFPDPPLEPATSFAEEIPPDDEAGLPSAPSVTAPAADGSAEKPEAQRIIDRLIERLKERGQGLAAARILVRHGGYGRDPAAARDLYAELRALLLAGRSQE